MDATKVPRATDCDSAPWEKSAYRRTSIGSGSKSPTTVTLADSLHCVPSSRVSVPPRTSTSPHGVSAPVALSTSARRCDAL